MQKNNLLPQRPLRTAIEWMSTKLQAVPPELRIVLMTIILGFITHGFVYANTLLGHDNIHLYASGLNAVRWSSQLFYFLRAGLQLPWVIGLISLLELGIVNVLLERLFDLRRLSTQLLLLITVLTFPSVIAFHNYGSVDLFTGALLLSVLSVYLSNRKGVVNLFLSIACLTVSIATYQAYISTAATLMLLLLLARLTIGQEKTKAVLLDAIKALVILVASIAIYYTITMKLTQVGVAGVTSYRNQDMMGIFTLDQLLGWIKEAYKTVRDYYLSAALNPLPLWVAVLQLTCLAVVAFFSIARLFREHFFKKPGCVFLAIVFVALLPLAINAIQVLNSGFTPHLLMTFAFIAPWLFVLQYGEWLLDERSASQNRSSAVPKIASVVCALMVCMNAFYGYILANADYVGRKMNYDASLSLATRLVSRIESVPGYRLDTPVIFVGSLFAPYYASQRQGFEMANAVVGSTSNSGQAMTYNDEYGSTIQWFIRTALSSNMVFVPDRDIDIYRNNKDVMAMNAYPANDCCLWVGNVLVMKLSD